MTVEQPRLKTLGPEWFSPSMGTGSVTIACLMVSIYIPIFQTIAAVFFSITLFLFVLVFFLFLSRFKKYPNETKQDLFHPIKSNFFPMMPISIIVIDIALHKYNTLVFHSTFIEYITHILFWIGTFGIFLFGWEIILVTFINVHVKPDHANFGWFIPPVSHLIIPVLGLSLAPHLPPSIYTSILVIISCIASGIGFFLFLFVGSLIYHRYTYLNLPISKIAPTFLIGIAPTSIIVIILSKLMVIPPHISFGFDFTQLGAFFGMISLIFWGFSVWWIVLSFGLLVHYVKNRNHHFYISWWAYIFPSGIFIIATGVMESMLHESLFTIIFIMLTVILMGMWVLVTTEMLTKIWYKSPYRIKKSKPPFKYQG